MAIVQCINQHYYDDSRNSSCPYCAKLSTAPAGTGELGEQFTSYLGNDVFDSGDATVAMDDFLALYADTPETSNYTPAAYAKVTSLTPRDGGYDVRYMVIQESALRQAYGIDWDEACGVVSWHEFLVLVGALPFDTPLGRAMYYRNPKNRPERTKYNEKQVAEFDRLHSLFRLEDKKGSQDRIEAQQHAMDDMALAFRRRMRKAR